jgi:hypothetical protein
MIERLVNAVAFAAFAASNVDSAALDVLREARAA